MLCRMEAERSSEPPISHRKPFNNTYNVGGL